MTSSNALSAVASSTFVVAVTGGIGSGKSTISDCFSKQYGIAVIDADIVSREVVEPKQPALSELVACFGSEVLDTEGRLDRPQLKRIVFADDAKRKQLEAILHPRIRRRMAEHITAVRSRYCLLGIPLLAEGGNRELIDRVLVVDCAEATQLARVLKRDNLTEPEVLAIMRSQASREQRLAIADDIIVNDGDVAGLGQEIETLHQRYCALADQKAGVNN